MKEMTKTTMIEQERKAAEETGQVQLNSKVHSIKEIGNDTGLSRPTIYKEINSGRLRTFTVGARRLVSEEAFLDWIRAREEATALKA